MVAGRPWYQKNPADFLMATAHYDLELKGAYAVLIDLLNDRDRPIPDEPRFIAGQLGCTVRKWAKIRARLLGDHKLVETGDGYLTNPRFERERAQRRGDHETAVLWGRAGGVKSAAIRQGELDLDEGWEETAEPPERARAHGETADSPKTSRKLASKLPKTSKLVGNDDRTVKTKPNEIKPNGQPPPQAPCARESTELREEDSSHPTSESSPPRGKPDEADLVALTSKVCEAAGFRPGNPDQLARATNLVAEWRQQGVSFDDVVLPVIEHIMAHSTERTRTLGRFKVEVAHQNAKRRAALKAGIEPKFPATPQMEPPDENPLFRPMRRDLLESLGPNAYCLALNDARFVDVGPCHGDKHPVQVRHRMEHWESELRHGRWASAIRKAAKAHGFTDLW